MMYSPAWLNVAVVVALPSVLSTGGFRLLNVTAPGPRNRLQLTVTGASGARRLGSTIASSLAQIVRVSGEPTMASYEALIPRGGPCNGVPCGWNFRTGGVFFSAASRNGSIS